ncbi:MAG: 4-hydroxy-tetrahydrodipicolinate reductase [Candidatus Omnitrophica bacterium]|nr:4-hydroxy-tetrahydrodipicolinate reductase [Candidatus Omnitrophota bacterium]
MTKIVITGISGRMGKRIASLALQEETFRILGAVEDKGHPDIGRPLEEIVGVCCSDIKISDDLAGAAKGADVIIDFTSAPSTLSNLDIAQKLNLPIVIGTTGLTEEDLRAVKKASGSIPVLFSSNMSMGVNLLFRVAPEIANALGKDYDIEIVEAHHSRKKDSPSGTAKKLAELIAEAKGKRLKDIAVYGREGDVGRRPKGQLGIHSVRAGDIVGDHTVVYAGDNERIEITHRAHSRDVFAQGALRAARFLADKSPGLYDMQDVIGGI